MLFNDYETIYIYKKWHSDLALEIIIDKYKPLILSKLDKFRVRHEHYDDFIQELSMTICHAVDIFNQDEGKTFTRFVELLIERRLIKLITKEANREKIYSKIEDVGYDFHSPDGYLNYLEKKEVINSVNEIDFNPIEKLILSDVISKGEDVSSFAKRYHLTAKKVYNLTYKIRKKLSKLNPK